MYVHSDFGLTPSELITKHAFGLDTSAWHLPLRYRFRGSSHTWTMWFRTPEGRDRYRARLGPFVVWEEADATAYVKV